MKTLNHPGEWLRARQALRAQGVDAPGLDETIARVLGFERTAALPRNEKRPVGPVPAGGVKPPIVVEAPHEPLAPNHHTGGENLGWITDVERRRETRNLSWLHEGAVLPPTSTPPAMLPEPLVPASSMRAVVLGLLGVRRRDGDVDTARLVETLAEDGEVAQIPRMMRERRVSRVQLLIDVSAGSDLLADDALAVREVVVRQYAPGDRTLLFFDGSPGRVTREDSADDEPCPIPSASTMVLIVGAPQNDWLPLLEQLHRAGVPVTVLTPRPPRSLPVALLGRVTAVYWDRSTTVAQIRRARRGPLRPPSPPRAKADDLRELARWVALAPRIPAALVRHARLSLRPLPSTHLESELWTSGWVESRMASEIVLRPEIAAILRAELRAAGKSDQAADLLRSLTPAGADLDLPALERELAIACTDPARSIEIEHRWREVVRAFEGGRRGLGRWALGLLRHLPEEGRTPASTLLKGLALSALFPEGRALSMNERAQLEPGAQALLDERTEIAVGVRWTSAGHLVVREPPEPGAEIIRMPAREPRSLAVREAEGEAQVMEWMPGAVPAPIAVRLPVVIEGAGVVVKMEEAETVRVRWGDANGVGWLCDAQGVPRWPLVILPEGETLQCAIWLAHLVEAGAVLGATVRIKLLGATKAVTEGRYASCANAEAVGPLGLIEIPSRLAAPPTETARNLRAVGQDSAAAVWPRLVSVGQRARRAPAVTLETMIEGSQTAQYAGAPVIDERSGSAAGLLVPAGGALEVRTMEVVQRYSGGLAAESWAGMPRLLAGLDPRSEPRARVFPPGVFAVEAQFASRDRRPIVIQGPPGCGKKTLVREVLRRFGRTYVGTGSLVSFSIDAGSAHWMKDFGRALRAAQSEAVAVVLLRGQVDPHQLGAALEDQEGSGCRLLVIVTLSRWDPNNSYLPCLPLSPDGGGEILRAAGVRDARTWSAAVFGHPGLLTDLASLPGVDHMTLPQALSALVGRDTELRRYANQLTSSFPRESHRAIVEVGLAAQADLLGPSLFRWPPGHRRGHHLLPDKRSFDLNGYLRALFFETRSTVTDQLPLPESNS